MQFLHCVSNHFIQHFLQQKNYGKKNHFFNNNIAIVTLERNSKWVTGIVSSSCTSTGINSGEVPIKNKTGFNQIIFLTNH